MPEAEAVIPTIDERLKSWVKYAAGDVAVGFRRATAPSPGAGVNLYLYEITSRPAPSASDRQPQRIFLRYLVTATAEDPVEAHGLLEKLIFSALEEKDFEVELDPVPMAFWSAFGAPPQPSFTLRIPAMRERAMLERPKPPHIPVFQLAPVSDLRGVVLDADGRPQASCAVELRVGFSELDERLDKSKAGALRVRFSTTTDSHGRFRLQSVPRESAQASLRVVSGGYEQTFPLIQPASPESSLELRLNTKEE